MSIEFKCEGIFHFCIDILNYLQEQKEEEKKREKKEKGEINSLRFE